MTSGPLTATAREVLVRAVETYRHEPHVAAWLDAQVARLEGPLRIAVAGKVKAGKSTLLNALVGEQIAPSDAGECSTSRLATHPTASSSSRGSAASPIRRTPTCRCGCAAAVMSMCW